MKLIVVKSSDHVQWSILVYSTITFYSSYAPTPPFHLLLPFFPALFSLLGPAAWLYRKEGEEEGRVRGGEREGKGEGGKGRGRGREREGRGRGRGEGEGGEREGEGRGRGGEREGRGEGRGEGGEGRERGKESQEERQGSIEPVCTCSVRLSPVKLEVYELVVLQPECHEHCWSSCWHAHRVCPHLCKSTSCQLSVECMYCGQGD